MFYLNQQKMKEKEELKFAVLIDADNVPYANVKGMLNEITKYGIPTIKRIYGDWTKPTVSGWKSVLLENAITPIQQYSYTNGKNATDSAMIIDAMDILHSGDLDGFCIVSSDSDFTRLATRLRESGKFVVGIGERKTPRPFIVSCDKFIYIEILGEAKTNDIKVEGDTEKKDSSKKTTKVRRHSPKVPNEVIKLLEDTINDVTDESGWAFLANVGNSIIKKQPDFDPRNYGFEKLTPLISSCSSNFEIDSRDIENSPNKHIYVRVKS